MAIPLLQSFFIMGKVLRTDLFIGNSKEGSEQALILGITQSKQLAFARGLERASPS